ncbi:Mu transposase C-terminal domain-containing protein [Rubrivivax sp. RP6-9]|uniref:Mu transposase C-terminal domain-containing protein n=1 Tax=Rubrivivax sp. RP6-9 TaxID=3415750 RepID=UPI003CC59312
MSTETDKVYFRNEVLRRDDGTLHRLLRLNLQIVDEGGGEQSLTGSAWLILLGAPLALPYEVSYEDLQAQFSKLPKKEEAPAPAKSELFTTVMTALPRPPSKASLAVSDRAHQRIEPLVDHPDIFDPSKRHALLVERSKAANGGTPKTLLKDLRYWWQGGQTQDALLGKYSNCGRPDVVGTAGRGRTKGRKRKSDDVNAGSASPNDDTDKETEKEKASKGTPAYQLTQADLDHMKEVIEKYFLQKKVRLTLTKTLEKLHELHYTYTDGNGAEHLRPKDECPSYRQLSYYLHQNYPTETILSSRKGAKRFAQEDRSTEGSIQFECHGASHIYEFDATILDVPLVSSKSRMDIVGKPTLYLIIDRHSRLIVGWYLGFENANYSSAMEAILSLGANKEALCRSLEIPYDPADWPADGILPEIFLADQGANTSKKARRIARSLRATLSNVPGLRPDWKPLVECGFAMLHQVIAPDTPAYTPDAETKQRRAVNRDKDVALNLLEMLKVIISAIIAHNRSPQEGYPLSIEQVADGVRPIPRELYVHSIRRRMGQLDRMDFDKVRAELMPRDKATVSEDGIYFKRMYYSCPEAKERGWLVDGRKKRKPIEIAFDYRLVDEIIVYSPNGSGESFVAKLVGDSTKFEGMSHVEVERHFVRVKDILDAGGEEKRQAMFGHRQRTAPTIDNAVKETKKEVNGASRSSRRADTAAARADELQGEHAKTAGVRPPKVRNAEPIAPPPPTDPARPLASAPTSAAVIPIGRGPQLAVAAPAADIKEVPFEDLPLAQRIAALRRGASK